MRYTKGKFKFDCIFLCIECPCSENIFVKTYNLILLDSQDNGQFVAEPKTKMKSAFLPCSCFIRFPGIFNVIRNEKTLEGQTLLRC